MITENSRQISVWLFACCFCVILMVAIGGITRITRSGLSITEWKPITGILPPLSKPAWDNEFAKYQRIPEFRQINRLMTLIEFKRIFYMEYFHRLLARVTLLVCLIPLVVFRFSRRITTRYTIRLLAIFSLIGIQGLIGWYMVRSGLTQRTSVNEFWLAGHLIFAVIILSLILNEGLINKYRVKIEKTDTIIYNIPLLVVTFIITPLQIFFGGLTAGLHITHLCHQNTDAICKFDFFNVIKYHEGVPFLYFHKLFAFILFFGIITVVFLSLKKQKLQSLLLIFLTIIQIALGILTLFVSVDNKLINYFAILHQINGILIYITLFIIFFRTRYEI